MHSAPRIVYDRHPNQQECVGEEAGQRSWQGEVVIKVHLQARLAERRACISGGVHIPSPAPSPLPRHAPDSLSDLKHPKSDSLA